MRTHIIALFFVLFSNISIGQSDVLPEVPDSLKTDAEGVVLDYTMNLEVVNKFKIKYKYKYDLLILKNSKDTEISKVFIPYDKYSTLIDLVVKVKDLNGKEIRTLRKKDFTDQLVLGDEISTDQRVLYYDFLEKQNTFILSVSYEVESKQSFNLIEYRPFLARKTSILKSKFIVSNEDKNNNIRFFIPDSILFKKGELKKHPLLESYTYELNHLKYKPRFLESSIAVVLDQFQMEGIDGNQSTWKNYGDWILKINKGQDNMDLKFTPEIKELIKGVDDKKEKIKILYQYLQKNMRYISIQLGIGGYKAMHVNDVHHLKYGDCKALTNYMKAILAIADIPSNYVLINAGENKKLDIKENFPVNIFNHMILGIPMESDTMYLDCVSNTLPTGYLGIFTNNRKALFLSPNQSKLVFTPISENNTINNLFQLSRDSTGELAVIWEQELHNDAINHYYLGETPTISDDVFKKYILDNIIDGVKNLMIIDRSKTFDTTFTWKCSFTSSKLISKTGNRIFINLNMDRLPKNITDVIENKESVFVKDGNAFLIRPMTVNDEIKLIIPEGCNIEYIPKKMDYTSGFGSLKLDASTNQNILILKRNLDFKEGKFKTKDEAFITFLKNVKKMQQEKLVVICNK